ncbi:MAG: glutamate 5-kinase [Acidimicrobiaceae bacterium]|nr:glutamate 5-kinase [Acidimicrobiaceae bacterium]MDQ1418740.1 glutamate 5-kinase [Acidimicrobiaceae bacterium]
MSGVGSPAIVVKIGTSSITDGRGVISEAAIDKLSSEVAALHRRGERVVIVTSGAIAAGLPALGMSDAPPTDSPTLQAISAVGQSRLMRVWDDALGRNELVGGQVLLAPLDFVDRKHYLHARQTLGRLLDLGVVPVVNENDAIADDEVRFGDNDRLAALVAHLVGAGLLVLLTDAPGLLTADPRLDRDASLIDEIVEVDQALEAVAGRSGNPRGSGGMASKLAAAKIAAWSGVRAVIAAADRPGVLLDAVDGVPVGTAIRPRDRRLSARKLWIAFAVGASGTVVVDDGARSALVHRPTSLLPAGVVAVEGSFDADDAVEIAGTDGRVFAKGLVRHPAARIKEWAGLRTSALPPDVPHEVVHRDDLVVLP